MHVNEFSLTILRLHVLCIADAIVFCYRTSRCTNLRCQRRRLLRQPQILPPVPAQRLQQQANEQMEGPGPGQRYQRQLPAPPDQHGHRATVLHRTQQLPVPREGGSTGGNG